MDTIETLNAQLRQAIAERDAKQAAWASARDSAPEVRAAWDDADWDRLQSQANRAIDRVLDLERAIRRANGIDTSVG
jgi:hypothetical protein